MLIGGAIAGLPQQRSQERRGVRGRLFHVCDRAHTGIPGLAFAPCRYILQNCHVIAPG